MSGGDPAGGGPGQGEARRIAVVRALPGVGDMLCAVPALRALRAAHPRARVTLVGLASAAWFVERFSHLVDDLLEVAGVTGLPEVAPDRQACARFRREAVARRFDMALQLHGSGVSSNAVTAMLGAGHQVSAYLPGRWRPPGTVVRYPDDRHEIDRLLAVVEAAGIAPGGRDVTFPLTAEERAQAARLVGAPPTGATAKTTATATGGSSPPVPPPYACVHPGASRPGNRWSPEGFAAAADRAAATGLAVVLTGTGAERPVTAEVARRRRGPSLDVTGRTDVAGLAALFAGARLVVSNDTGAAHVAAAVGTPSVVVFAPGGDPGRWAPLDGRRHRAVLPERGAWPPVGTVLAAVDDQLAVDGPAGRAVPARPSPPAPPLPEVLR
ncbi:MAG TPA: glycosyltransferase family 9 protein [Acidimicrobiales bacterium]|nr:glycosyltransferase family 9 protein [Acidimicrobiales bacterium]